MEQKTETQYPRVSEVAEAYHAVIVFDEWLEYAQHDACYLKWAVLALHSALQKLMVITLKSTCNLPITKWKNDCKEKSQYEIVFNPTPKLGVFMKLFKMIKSDDYMNHHPFADKGGSVTKQIKDLNEIRNDFMHYMPKAWSADMQNLAPRFAAGLRVMAFLTGDCPELRRQFTPQQLAGMQNAIVTSSALLAEIVSKQ